MARALGGKGQRMTTDNKNPPGKNIPGKTPAGTKAAGKKTSGLKVRVHTARKRSLSSTLWLQRQLNDPYVAKAKQEGWRSRAAFKLLEIDERFHLFRAGMRVVDLGAAPGGWLQVAAKKVRPEDGQGQIIGIDLLPIDPMPGVHLQVMDFLDPDAPDLLRGLMNGPADAVLSDMAANATGHRQTDHIRIVALAEMAGDFAAQILAPGGFFLAKVLQGGSEHTLLTQLKKDFTTVRHIKPAASRADSAELYVLATGFRGGNTVP
jgi:23S rRNA (uridine2552-2'-O)-methyltransferase